VKDIFSFLWLTGLALSVSGLGYAWINLHRIGVSYYDIVRNEYTEVWTALMNEETHEFGYQKRVKGYFAKVTLSIQDTRLQTMRRKAYRLRWMALTYFFVCAFLIIFSKYMTT
jgi:hypothetical protein